jgi:hypothetical protein
MEQKKDNTIVKINTERNFADEVFKKYRSQRYGIGTCCSSNLPSYIKDKYLCDYQDAKITQYDSITRTRTIYTPPVTGAKDDPSRPGWVDELCGNSKEEVEIYFYYDSTSLGIAEVQAAYTAAHSWVNLVRAEALVLNENDNSCRASASQDIREYHTVVFGERWLDWGSSTMTGSFNNSGSCQADSKFPVTVDNNSKFWGILKWAQTNNILMYSGVGVGGETVASTATTNTSTIFAGVVSNGKPPIASYKNLLAVTFIDEATAWSGTVGPYHGRKTSGNTTPASWADATSNIGTANDGSDAVIQACWKLDYAFFISTRNNYLSQGADYKANFFCYPSAPSNPGPSHKGFPLHAVGAISSGDKTVKDGTWTIAPYNFIVLLTRLQDGNPYFAQGYGALDQQGWGVQPDELPFTASGLKDDLNSFVDLTSCNDSECFFAVVKDANGNPVENHPIVFDGGIIAHTDELGFARWCVENASIDSTHNIDLCYCVSTIGNCTSSKFDITLIDNCLTACPVTPFQACLPNDVVISTGNEKEGCTDSRADNYDPNVTIDDGSCVYCSSLSIRYEVEPATETAGVCNNDGSITTTVTGGTAPYTFAWLKDGVAISDTTVDLANICGGVYTLIVTDRNLCRETVVIYVDQPDTRIFGCTDTLACNYNANATDDDGSCLFSGCTRSSAPNYDPLATADCNCAAFGTAAYQNAVGWESCCTLCEYGCIDPNANNYNAGATCDDGSCDYNWACQQTGGGTSSVCSGLQNVGFFASDALAFDWISDSANASLNQAVTGFIYSNTSLAPQGTECVDSLGNLEVQLKQITFHLIDDTLNITDPINCNGATWPAIWTTFLPTSSGVSTANFTSVQDLINALDTTIANGQVWEDAGGIISTFTSRTLSQIQAILSYSQGTASSSGALTNLIFPQCAFVRAELSYTTLNCDCQPGPPLVCTCTQMFDGTGIYPNNISCLAGTECCNPPPTNYICVPGNINDSCVAKDPADGTTVYAATPVLNGGINQTLAEAWTTLYPTNTNPQQYYWWIDGYLATCYDASLDASKVLLDEIILYKNGVSVVSISAGNTVSWNSLKANAILSDYDGVTYNNISALSYIQVRNTLDATEPGVWHLQGTIAQCNCEPDVNCTCILDANGTEPDFNTCMSTCCPTIGYGCGDPDAVNYTGGPKLNAGGCIYCDTWPAFANAAEVTISVIDPTTSSSNDGEITLIPIAVPPSNELFSYYIFDDNNVLVAGPVTGTGTSYVDGTIPEGLYTIYTYWHRPGPSGNIWYGIICSQEYTVQVGNPNASQLYECNPGSTTDSTSSLTFVNTLFASNDPVYTSPGQAVNTVATFAPNISIQDFWFYLDVNSTYWNPTPYMPINSDCFNSTLGAVKMTIDKITIFEAGAELTSITNSSWGGLANFIGGLVSQPPPTSLTDAAALLNAYDPIFTIVAYFLNATCTTTGCGCVQSATGTFPDATSCANGCCIVGCTDPTANNYVSTATIDDGSCLYCGGLSAIYTKINPYSPPQAGQPWPANEINVNNGSIFLVGVGGSGSYTTEVYYDGYNSDSQLPNPDALWPGQYQAKLTDTVTGCTVWIRDIELGVLSNKCYDLVGAYHIPIGLWSGSGIINYVNYKWDGSTATQDTVYNSVIANDGFIIDNLHPYAGTYTIRIYNSIGSMILSCAACTLPFSSAPAATGTYYIEIETTYNTCKLIGLLFEYNGLANP